MYNAHFNHGDILDLTPGFLFYHNGYGELKIRSLLGSRARAEIEIRVMESRNKNLHRQSADSF